MSNKKNIEDWAKSNKELFDDKELPVGHRELFESRLNSLLEESKPNKSRFHRYNIAAIFVVGIAIASSVFYFNNHTTKSEQYARKTGFVKIENQYSEKIKEALIPVRANNKYLLPEYRSFLKEMEKLDLENDKLKDLLIKFPDDERVLSSIIENYKDRLVLLEKLKTTISNNNLKKVNHDENL